MSPVLVALIVTGVIVAFVAWIVTFSLLLAKAYPWFGPDRPKLGMWAAIVFIVGLFVGILSVILAIGPQS